MENLQEIKREFIKTGDTDLDLVLGKGIAKESLISIISYNDCEEESIQFSQKLANLISDKVLQIDIVFGENIMENNFKMNDFYKLFKDEIKSKDRESVSTFILNINNIDYLNDANHSSFQELFKSIKRHCLNNNIYVICISHLQIFKSDSMEYSINLHSPSVLIYLFNLIFKVKKYNDLTLVKVIKHLDDLHLNLFYRLK